MGINGLLPVLKSIARPTHISKYKGSKAAIDGYSWLHKGAYCCSKELCEGTYTDKFVHYCLAKVELLCSHGVTPVLVFDGDRLPIKAEEEQGRHRNRQEARERAAAHMQAGNANAALECYQRAVDVTPAMAKQLIEALKEREVEFLVAPYEADAQLAYLARRGDVSIVITEDSDLIAYGCPRVLYKLDRSGAGEEVALEDLVLTKGMSFVGFTHDMFLDMCILAGCDFLANLPGIGIKKAHQQIRKYKGFAKVVKMLRFSGTPVPPGYELRFQRALWAFRHQRVYCPHAKTLVHLNPLPQGGIGARDVEVPAAVPQGAEAAELAFLGPPMCDEVARGVAAGDLDPVTKQPFDIVAIYRGCSCPPAHLAAVLGVDARQEGQAGGMARSSSAPPRIGLSRRRSGSASDVGKASAQPQRNGIMRYLTREGRPGTSGGPHAAQQQPLQQTQQQQQQQQTQPAEGADQHDPLDTAPAASTSLPHGLQQQGRMRPAAGAACRTHAQQGMPGPMDAEVSPVMEQHEPPPKRRRTKAATGHLHGFSLHQQHLQPWSPAETEQGQPCGADGLQSALGFVPVQQHAGGSAVLHSMAAHGSGDLILGDLAGDDGMQDGAIGLQEEQLFAARPTGSTHRAAAGLQQTTRLFVGPDRAGQGAMELDGGAHGIPAINAQPGNGLWGAVGLHASAAAPGSLGDSLDGSLGAGSVDAAGAGGMQARLCGSLDASLGGSWGSGALNPGTKCSLGASLDQIGSLDASLDGDLGGSFGADTGGVAGAALRGSGALLSSVAAARPARLSQQLQEALERSSMGASSSSGLASLRCTPSDADGDSPAVGRSGPVGVLAALSKGSLGHGWSDGLGSTWDPCEPATADDGDDDGDDDEVVSPVKPPPVARRSGFSLQRRRHAGSTQPVPRHSRFFVQQQLQAHAGGLEDSIISGGQLGGAGAGCGRTLAARLRSQLHASRQQEQKQQPLCLPDSEEDGEALADSEAGEQLLNGGSSQRLGCSDLPGYSCDDEALLTIAGPWQHRSRPLSGQQQPQRPLLGRQAPVGAAAVSLSNEEGDHMLAGATAAAHALPRMLGRHTLGASAAGLSDMTDGVADAAANGVDADAPPAAAYAAAPAAPYYAAADGAPAALGGSTAAPLIPPPHARVSQAAPGCRDLPADPCGVRGGLAGTQQAGDTGLASAEGASDGSSEPDSTGVDENTFNSIRHVKRYARLAAAAVDKVARHAGICAQPLQQSQQQQQQQGRGVLASRAARAQFRPPALAPRAAQQAGNAQQHSSGAFMQFACGARPS